MKHISSFPCRSSHYARSGAVHRQYLHPALSIMKMWKLYLHKNPALPCSYLLYYRVFVAKFNLGFGSPKKDVCKFCMTKKVDLKSAPDGMEKKIMEVQLELHRRQKNAFFTLLKSPDTTDTVTLVFDLMQNQPLPKTSIGDA